jgi:hypothetical protein
MARRLTTRVETRRFEDLKRRLEAISAKLSPSVSLALLLQRELRDTGAPRAPGLRPALADFIATGRAQVVSMAAAIRELEEMANDEDFTPVDHHERPLPDPPAPPDAKPRQLTPPPRRT